jgi:hypothetical protein
VQSCSDFLESFAEKLLLHSFIAQQQSCFTAIYSLDFIHRLLCFATTTFQGMALPLSSGKPTLLRPIDRANLYQWREEPSLEMLWLQNIETMDRVQRIDHNNTAPSSKTFRDE